MNPPAHSQQVNLAIEQCLGPFVPEIQRLGPSADAKKLEQQILASFSPDVAAEVMRLYTAGTTLPLDWRTTTTESARADLHELYQKDAPWLTPQARDILTSAAMAYGW